MKTVKYCKNSTITEAWTLIQGVPAEFNQDEIGAINNAAKKEIEKLSVIPTFLIRANSSQIEPAFWTDNFSWDNGAYQARTGHRYLSVHRLCSQANKYVDYEQSILPQIKRWLEIYAKEVSKPKEFQIETLAFGYINTFEFDAKNFDLSKYFGVNLGFKIDNFKPEVSSLNTAFNFFEAETGYSIQTAIEVSSSPADSKKLILKTHITTELKNIKKSFSVADEEKIIQNIFNLKEKSKRVFFGLTTKETQNLMEAE